MAKKGAGKAAFHPIKFVERLDWFFTSLKEGGNLPVN